jgi:hypothetical protein
MPEGAGGGKLGVPMVAASRPFGPRGAAGRGAVEYQGTSQTCPAKGLFTPPRAALTRANLTTPRITRAHSPPAPETTRTDIAKLP